MKKILFNKLLTDCLIFFFIALFFTSIIIWIFQAVNYLDIMIEDGRDHLVYLKFTFLISANPPLISKSELNPNLLSKEQAIILLYPPAQ